MKEIPTVILEFLERANIERINQSMETVNFHQTDDKNIYCLSISSSDYQGGNDEEQHIILILDLKQNIVYIREEKKNTYDCQDIDDENDFSIYRIHDQQKIVEFIVDNDELNITTATISQNTTEDTLGNQCVPIVEFNSIGDFAISRKLSAVIEDPTILQESYRVSHNFNVINGLKDIGEKLPSNCVAKIKK